MPVKRSHGDILWLVCLWGGTAAVVFVNMIRVIQRQNIRGIWSFAAASTRRNSNLFSLNWPRVATYLLWHNGGDDDRDDDDDGGGHYEDGVWGQAEEKHICGVEDGRRVGSDERLFECCHYMKASPGCPCTLTPVAKSQRPRPSGRSVCLLVLKASGSRIQARVRGLDTCPKSKL